MEYTSPRDFFTDLGKPDVVANYHFRMKFYSEQWIEWRTEWNMQRLQNQVFTFEMPKWQLGAMFDLQLFANPVWHVCLNTATFMENVEFNIGWEQQLI